MRQYIKKHIHLIDKKEATRGLLIIVSLIALSVVVTTYIGEDTLEMRVKQAGMRGPVLVILLKAGSVIFAPLSGSVLYVIAGGLYGTYTAILYSIYGNFLGISCAFYLGRKRGAKLVSLLVGEKNFHEVQHLISHLDTTKNFLLTRILLFPLEDLVNYAAGMSRLSYGVFIVISMITSTAVALLPILIGNWAF